MFTSQQQEYFAWSRSNYLTSAHHAFKRGGKKDRNKSKMTEQEKKCLNSSIWCQVKTFWRKIKRSFQENSFLPHLIPYFCLSVLPYNLCLGCVKRWGNNIRQGCDCPNHQGALSSRVAACTEQKGQLCVWEIQTFNNVQNIYIYITKCTFVYFL